MSPQSLVVVVLVLLAALPTAKSEMFYRALQLQSNLRNETCNVREEENRYYCNVNTTITSATEQVDVYAWVGCNITTPGDTDFRQAGSTSDCECSATVTNVLTGQEASCSCQVCSSGGGDHPVALDCGEDLIIGDCLSMGCDLTCNKTCSETCPTSVPDTDCVKCPESLAEDDPPELPVLANVIFNTTTDENCVSTGESTLTCTQDARIYMPDNETAYSDVSMTLECEIDDSNVLDPTRTCQCGSVQVIDAASGQLTDCRCSTCPAGFGTNPIAIVCTHDSAVADCTVVDCNSQCNGTCVLGCEGAGKECSFKIF